MAVETGGGGLVQTQDFILLHVPKTGGMWLREVLEAYAPAGWSVNAEPERIHHGVRELTSAERAKPLLAVVRNPWDWYVSWFYYNPGHPQFVSFARTIDGFRAALPHLVACADREDQWRVLTDNDGTLPAGLTVVKYESLLGNVVGAIEGLGVTVPPGFVTSASAHARVNVGEARRARHAPAGDPEAPDPYADHYTQTEIDLVAAAEAPLIAAFGYTFA